MSKQQWFIELVYTDGVREVFNNVTGVDLIDGWILLYIQDKRDIVKKQHVVRYTAWRQTG